MIIIIRDTLTKNLAFKKVSDNDNDGFIYEPKINLIENLLGNLWNEINFSLQKFVKEKILLSILIVFWLLIIILYLFGRYKNKEVNPFEGIVQRFIMKRRYSRLTFLIDPRDPISLCLELGWSCLKL